MEKLFKITLPLTFSKLLVGVLFIVSGFVKANDTLGFSYKLEEYFSAGVLNIEFFIPYAFLLAAGICIAEIVLGVMVLIGARPKFTSWSLLGMIVFFTFLTLYSAYFNKVTDCGCFGDAVKLTPWESFAKDIILIFFITTIFFRKNVIKPILSIKMENMFLVVITFFCFAFVYHTYNHLPMKDFRPYTIGKSIPEIGTTTFRPPYVPISLGSITGAEKKALFKPTRKTVIDPWHDRNQAFWEPVGDWRRPFSYIKESETVEKSVEREVRNTRMNVGILDASTLGKILVSGPDSGKFLDLI